MTINHIIELHYDELYHQFARIKDKAIAQSRTDEDVIHDVMYVALKKYQNQDISEDEGLAYLKKALAMAKKFQKNKKSMDLILIENLKVFDNEPLPDD